MGVRVGDEDREDKIRVVPKEPLRPIVAALN